MAYQDRYFKFSEWHWNKKAAEAARWQSLKSDLRSKMGNLLAYTLNFLKWHKWNAIATIDAIRDHFNLDDDELEMLKECRWHKLIREYICPSKELTETGNPKMLYIGWNVADCRTLINRRRKIMKEENQHG